MSSATSSSPPPLHANWCTRGLDTLAYLLALVAFFPAAGVVGMFGMFAYLWRFGPKNPDGFMTGRRFVFEFFASPLLSQVLLCDFVAIGIAGAAYAIVFRRSHQDGYRMAAAARRLAIVVLGQ